MLDSRAVNRIAIIGCGGSGKSHLARQLGTALAIPVAHLDALYYDSEWNALPADRFAELQRELAALTAVLSAHAGSHVGASGTRA